MTLNLALRLGAVASAAFDPLSIAWDWAAWAQDPNWTPPGDGVAVSSWNDASSGTRHATQATGTKQPIYRASESGMNNKPTVDFDGTDDFLATTTWSISQPTTRVIAFRIKAVQANRHFFSTNVIGGRNDINQGEFTKWVAYGGNQLISTTAIDTSCHFLIAEFNSTSGKLILDGTTLATGDIGTQAHNDVCLGTIAGAAGSGSSVHIGFAAVYAGILSAGDKANLLAWSRSHYGTP